jgi:hypothetical protein
MNSMMGSRGPAGSMQKGTSTGGNIIPKGYKQGQMQQFTPEQMQLFQQMFAQVSPDSYLSKLAGGDESLFQEMEAPAMRQFQGLQGDLASRFSGMGMGARRGSGFQNAANQATSDFAMDLASKRQALQKQAIMDLMGLSENLLGQRPYEQFLQQKPQKSASSGWGSLIGAGVGGVGGFFAGGPAGALSGAQLGYGIGSAF